MDCRNIYFVTGTAYAGKSTLVKNLARKYDGSQKACAQYWVQAFPFIDSGCVSIQRVFDRNVCFENPYIIPKPVKCTVTAKPAVSSTA